MHICFTFGRRNGKIIGGRNGKYLVEEMEKL